jgi:hypothetical protein
VVLRGCCGGVGRDGGFGGGGGGCDGGEGRALVKGVGGEDGGIFVLLELVGC